MMKNDQNREVVLDEKIENMFYGRKTPAEGEATQFVTSLEIVPDTINVEERTCEFVAATDRWINRYWWTEKLEISEEAIDTSRLQQGISFCNNHRHGEVHGISVGYRIEADTGKLILKVKFSSKQESVDIFNDIAEGIRKYVSIGYIVINQTVTRYDGDEDGKPDEYLVTKWQPIELSTVGVPADEESISRNTEINRNQQKADNNERKIVSEKDKGGAGSESPDTKAIERDYQAKLEKRTAEVEQILSMGAKYGLEKQARQHIQEQGSLQRFQEIVLDDMEEKSRNETPETQLDMEERQVNEYSLFNAVRAFRDGGLARMQKEAPAEFEAHMAVQEKLGREAQGFYVPMDIQNDFAQRLATGGRRQLNAQKREMLVSSATEGANLVGTDHRGDMFIDLLFENTYLFQLGARVIDNLQGDVDIPRGEGGVTQEWVGEAAAPTPTEGLIGQVALTYKTIAAATGLSRKLMKQSSPSAEAYIIDLLMKTAGIGIDTAGFQGAGGASILGIVNTPGINSVPIVGTFPDWGEVVDMETAVATDNALIDNMAFVCHPGVAGSWKKTLKSAGVSGYIAEGNEVNGYQFHRKTGLAAETCVFGNYRDFLFGMWGVLDLVVDKSTNVSSGGTVLRSFQDVDGVVTHTGSFCKNG
jgi:HK97 family phage major capsid protein